MDSIDLSKVIEKVLYNHTPFEHGQRCKCEWRASFPASAHGQPLEQHRKHVSLRVAKMILGTVTLG
jgi:hypothetical protein